MVVTPFGLTGPYVGYRAHHLVSFHAGGEGSILPSGPGWQQFPERPPIQVGGELAEYDAGWNAAVAVLGAMYDRLRTGRGQQIDISIQESELTLNRTRLSRFNNDEIVLRREGSRYGFMGMMRCRDGWVQLVGATPAQWDALAASPDAGDLADVRIATAAARAENMELAAAALQAWCEQHDKADVVRILAPLGCPVGAYATPADLVASAQLEHREFFREVDDGRGGHVLVPGPPYRCSVTPVEIRSAPTLGRGTGFAGARADKPRLPRGRGLEGVRILDFTWAAAGPYATCLLAPAGRGSGQGRVHETPRPGPTGLPHRLRRDQPLAELQRAQPRQAVVPGRPVRTRRACARAPARGVGRCRRRQLPPGRHDEVRSRCRDAPRPAAGARSWRPRRPTAPPARTRWRPVWPASSARPAGSREQTGYADGPPTEIGESTDYRSGNALAVGVLAALLHRARTGEGQHVDLASREVVAASSPDALLAEQLGVAWPIRVGNAHREFAPHDVYPAAGEDDWVAVAVGEESEWAGLCTLLDCEELVPTPPDRGCPPRRVCRDRRRDRRLDSAAVVAAKRSGHSRLQACRRWR